MCVCVRARARARECVYPRGLRSYAERPAVRQLMETYGMGHAQIELAREVFDLYDRDNSGTMDAMELQETLVYLGNDPTIDEATAMIAGDAP
jgi:Ca2+-binding EF-hand superfamily protein